MGGAFALLTIVVGVLFLAKGCLTIQQNIIAAFDGSAALCLAGEQVAASPSRRVQLIAALGRQGDLSCFPDTGRVHGGESYGPRQRNNRLLFP